MNPTHLGPLSRTVWEGETTTIKINFAGVQNWMKPGTYVMEEHGMWGNWVYPDYQPGDQVTIHLPQYGGVDFVGGHAITGYLDQDLTARFLIDADMDRIVEGNETFTAEIFDQFYTITVIDADRATTQPGLTGTLEPAVVAPTEAYSANRTPVYNTNIQNTVVNGTQYFTTGRDTLTGQADVRIGLLAGNDTIEIVGGNNNFVNGNQGADILNIMGGSGRYLGGRDGDSINVTNALAGTQVNGNQGSDIITGSVDAVTYRGGAGNDTIRVSSGTVYGDVGNDTFVAVAGDGVAVVQDYQGGSVVRGTANGDVIQGLAGGSLSLTAEGAVYGVGGDQMLLLAGVTDLSQVTVV